MNEIIKSGDEIASLGIADKDVIERIVRNALKTRPERNVYYMLNKRQPGIEFSAALEYQSVDLLQYYPNSQEGDVCAVDFMISAERDYEIYLNVCGNVSVYYNKRFIKTLHDGEFYHIPLKVYKNKKNFVRMLCVKNDGKFGFKFVISVKRYPKMWANDYLFAARTLCPAPYYYGEEGFGITKCVSSSEIEKLDENYIFPIPPIKSEDFEFENKNAVYYVYTEAAVNHVFLPHGNVLNVWVNGSKKKNCCRVKVGDRILVKCTDRLSLDTNKLCISFLKTNRQYGHKALFLGPFYSNAVHAPEFDFDFSKVFTNEKGERLYWHSCDGSLLRIYMDSVFFGQWFYALMVGFYGIRRCGIFLKDESLQYLFCKNMRFMAKYFDYICFDADNNKMPAFMPRITAMNVLDNIGTMGMNLIDCYFDCNDSGLLMLIEKIAEHMINDIPCFGDGTFNRNDTMWADDLYMSCPFLIRMGILTGNADWYNKAVRQVEGFKKRLYMHDEMLFSHIFFTDINKPNTVAWGRGNGWVMWTLSEILLYAEGKTDVSTVKKLFIDMSYSLLKHQDKSGLWRQVINRNDSESYLETSCTAMYLLAFSRGMSMGLLPKEDFKPAAQRAWSGLKNNCIDKDGNVYGVCMGSGCSMKAEYYFDIPTVINDDHGMGVILAAGCEWLNFLEETNE